MTVVSRTIICRFEDNEMHSETIKTRSFIEVSHLSRSSERSGEGEIAGFLLDELVDRLDVEHRLLGELVVDREQGSRENNIAEELVAKEGNSDSIGLNETSSSHGESAETNKLTSKTQTSCKQQNKPIASAREPNTEVSDDEELEASHDGGGTDQERIGRASQQVLAQQDVEAHARISKRRPDAETSESASGREAHET